MTFQLIKEVRPTAINVSEFPRAGPYGWLTPYIAAIAAHNDDIRTRVLFLARSELHFIGLILSLIGSKRDDPDHLAAFACELGTLPRAKLVATSAALGNYGAAPALASLAPRLAGKIWRRPSYLRLVSLMNEPHGRKVLAHLPHISRRQVATLTCLPPAFRAVGVGAAPQAINPNAWFDLN